jgi:RNA polymerase sigma-70 factor (ECF subfamily)
MRQYSEDAALVEDWVQRAFIKAYNNIGSFQGEARFSTWLFSIALNEMRTDRRRPSFALVGMDEAGDPGTQEDEAAEFEWDDLMKSSLKALDEPKRTVFLLYEVEGYSHAEISAMLAISEGNSRALLMRAKLFLRNHWELENTR